MGRKIEIFSAGCVICKETIETVRKLAGPDDEIHVRDMYQQETASRAKELDIRSLPAVIIDDKLTGCCAGGLFGSGDNQAVGSSSGLPTDRLVLVSAEKIEAELRSEIYAGLVGLTFEEEKATSAERLRNACCKLNDLIVKTTLTSPLNSPDE